MDSLSNDVYAPIKRTEAQAQKSNISDRSPNHKCDYEIYQRNASNVSSSNSNSLKLTKAVVGNELPVHERKGVLASQPESKSKHLNIKWNCIQNDAQNKHPFCNEIFTSPKAENRVSQIQNNVPQIPSEHHSPFLKYDRPNFSTLKPNESLLMPKEDYSLSPKLNDNQREILHQRPQSTTPFSRPISSPFNFQQGSSTMISKTPNLSTKSFNVSNIPNTNSKMEYNPIYNDNHKIIPNHSQELSRDSKYIETPSFPYQTNSNPATQYLYNPFPYSKYLVQPSLVNQQNNQVHYQAQDKQNHLQQPSIQNLNMKPKYATLNPAHLKGIEPTGYVPQNTVKYCEECSCRNQYLKNVEGYSVSGQQPPKSNLNYTQSLPRSNKSYYNGYCQDSYCQNCYYQDSNRLKAACSSYELYCYNNDIACRPKTGQYPYRHTYNPHLNQQSYIYNTNSFKNILPNSSEISADNYRLENSDKTNCSEFKRPVFQRSQSLPYYSTYTNDFRTENVDGAVGGILQQSTNSLLRSTKSKKSTHSRVTFFLSQNSDSLSQEENEVDLLQKSRKKSWNDEESTESSSESSEKEKLFCSNDSLEFIRKERTKKSTYFSE